MKTIKRLLAVVLCTAMLFSCCLVQAEETEEVTLYGTEYYEVLNALGITDYTEADLSSNIKRAEFYALVAKLGGYPAENAKNVIFADMTPATENEGYVRTLYKLGMIAPDANGNMYPDKEITPIEAASLIVKVLGYSPVAESKGGYPSGYLTMAGTLGILDEVTVNNNTLTKGEAVTMAYAALECDIMSQSMNIGGAAEYKVQNDCTLLESALGIELIEGVVNGVDITRVFGDNDVRPFYIEVDGREIYVEDLYIENLTKAYDFLGYDVCVYATEIRGYGTAALYIEKSKYNEEHIFDIEDITEIGSTSLKAYEPGGDKIKNYRFKKAVPLVYNGIATGLAFNEALIEGKTGTVKLVDNTGDGTADVVFADIYENVIASFVDKSKMVVYSESDPERKINVNNDADDPYVTIFDAEGVEINAGNIQKGNVLSVFESASDADQAFSRIYVSNTVVTGEIDAIEDDNEITVNGTVYELSYDCMENHSNLIRVGTSVTMYLDVYGEVAYIEAAKAMEYTMGFIVAAGTENGGLDSALKFKICTAPEEYVEAYAATNIRIDDIRYKNTDDEIYEHLNIAAKQMFPSSQEPDLYSSFVRFACNSVGEISVIDTIMHDKETVATRYSYLTDKNCLYAIHQASAHHRRSGNHSTLGNGVVLNANTILFAYPDLNDSTISVFDEDMYSNNKFTTEVVNAKTLSDTWAIYTDKDQIVTELVLQPFTNKAGGNDDENAFFAVVSKKSQMIDPENDANAVDCLTLMTNSGEVRVPVNKEITFAGLPIPAEGEAAKDPELVGTQVGETSNTTLTIDALKQGDVVRYGTNSKGYLSEITLYYRPTSDTVVASNGYFGAVTSVFNWYKGYVYDTYPEGFFFYTSKDLTGNIDQDREILENVTMEDCQFVYYTAYASCSSAGVDYSQYNDDLKVGGKSMAYLKSYVETGDDCTYGVLQRYYTYPRMFIAIEGLNN